MLALCDLSRNRAAASGTHMHCSNASLVHEAASINRPWLQMGCDFQQHQTNAVACKYRSGIKNWKSAVLDVKMMKTVVGRIGTKVAVRNPIIIASCPFRFLSFLRATPSYSITKTSNAIHLDSSCWVPTRYQGRSNPYARWQRACLAAAGDGLKTR